MIYRSGGRMLEIPNESEEINDLEAHWEAIAALVSDDVQRAQFDFSELLAARDVWAIIDFDLRGLVATGVLVDGSNREAIAQKRHTTAKSWDEVVERWHRILVTIGVGLLTLASIVSILNSEFHRVSAAPVAP